MNNAFQEQTVQEQMQQIRTQVEQCVQRAKELYGFLIPDVQVRFDLTGRAAGVACVRSGQYIVRFNVNHIKLGGQSFDHLLNDTVPHEVAHLVCFFNPKLGRAHNAGWKRVCIALGGNGRRCYSEDDAPEAVALQRPWVYITTAGYQVRVSKVVHTKIQRGITYTHKAGGKISRECQYSYMNAPAVAASKKPVVVDVTPKAPVVRSAPAATGSKADQLRAYLRQAKADVGSEAYERTVRWAVETLGMSASLARTYVKNNWSKV